MCVYEPVASLSLRVVMQRSVSRSQSGSMRSVASVAKIHPAHINRADATAHFPTLHPRINGPLHDAVKPDASYRVDKLMCVYEPVASLSLQVVMQWSVSRSQSGSRRSVASVAKIHPAHINRADATAHFPTLHAE